jgi:hypothetical protein
MKQRSLSWNDSPEIELCKTGLWPESLDHSGYFESHANKRLPRILHWAIILMLISGRFLAWLYANTDPEDSATHSVHNDLADA